MTCLRSLTLMTRVSMTRLRKLLCKVLWHNYQAERSVTLAQCASGYSPPPTVRCRNCGDVLDIEARQGPSGFVISEEEILKQFTAPNEPFDDLKIVPEGKPFAYKSPTPPRSGARDSRLPDAL